MGNAYSTIHKASARHYPPHRVARQMLLTKENKAAQRIEEEELVSRHRTRRTSSDSVLLSFDDIMFGIRAARARV